MYKQSSGRNNRSKGFKIKHLIQLFVLVAICLWLIYQVKHSHDKKREFEEKNIKTPSSLSNGAGDEVIKFGRKDVQARFEKTTLVTDGKVKEAEGRGDLEDNTNEEDEQEEDIKHEEKEDEGRGGGDDEIDDNNQHKFDMELEREENLIDEKDAEGKDTEDEEGERSEGETSEEGERSEGETSEEVERSRRENSEEVERSRRENSEEGERSRRENSEEGQREIENSEEVGRSDRENSEEGERSRIENFEEGQREIENSEEVGRSDRENSEEVEGSNGENSEEAQRERENSEEAQRERENSEEGQTERENSGEGQREREEEDHEAREEHYKADDASSAVAHETESESLEKLNERFPTEEESSNNVEEVKDGSQNSAQGNQTMGNDIPQNDVTTANGRSSLNSTTKIEKGSGLEEGNDPIERGIENSGGLLNKIPEEDDDRGPPSGGEEKTQETSRNIVHESASKGNTTTGAELDHSEAVEGEVVVEAAAAAGETNKSGSELEYGKQDPTSDSSLSDPIDSLDSSSSHLESSSAVHDQIRVDNIIRTMERSDAATT